MRSIHTTYAIDRLIAIDVLRTPALNGHSFPSVITSWLHHTGVSGDVIWLIGVMTTAQDR